VSDGLLLLITDSPVKFIANHNLSAEELPAINPESGISFVVQSEGADQEVIVLKIVLRSRLQRNVLYNTALAD
jgi:hypothetical protein